MRHLLIGAADAAHIRRYVRSVEQATAAPPTVWGWADLRARAPLPSLPSGPLLVRLGPPDGPEIAALESSAARPEGDIESAPDGMTALGEALVRLHHHLAQLGVAAHYAAPPRAVVHLLDQEARHQSLLRDGVPVPALVPAPHPKAEALSRYEALRERLRRAPDERVVVRLSRSLGTPPTVVAWMGGRGLRARANCRFTAAGAARSEVHQIADEAELRPLLGRLFELGAVVHEDWSGAAIAGRPFTLLALCTQRRAVLWQVAPGDPLRTADPVPDLHTVRQQVGRDLLQQMEETGVRLCRTHECVGLVLHLALSRRFDGFRVIDVDPFAELPGDPRDALGWSGSDHLVAGLRDLAAGVRAAV
jgi:hypothetical protein